MLFPKWSINMAIRLQDLRVRVLTSRLYIYYNAKEKITYLHFTPQQSTQKHSKFVITDTRKKPVDFFYCTTRVWTLAAATIFAKVSIPFQSIIPWSEVIFGSKLILRQV